MQKVTTFLMFDGQAEEAMKFYTSLFKHSEVVKVVYYGEEDPAMDGKVMHAVFKLAGQEYMCIDSNVKHEFSFTPSMSMYVTCDSEEEIDELYAKLSEGGEEMMPLGDYGFSKKFGWCSDRFGVSWQVNLA